MESMEFTHEQLALISTALRLTGGKSLRLGTRLTPKIGTVRDLYRQMGNEMLDLATKIDAYLEKLPRI